MDKHRRVWEQYVESWRVPSAAEKRALLETAVSPACTYRDPLAVARGPDELIQYMLEFHRQNPGGHFVTEQFITHHDRSIAHWRMMSGNGAALGNGVSYAEYDEMGRLVAMAGFFDTPTSSAS